MTINGATDDLIDLIFWGSLCALKIHEHIMNLIIEFICRTEQAMILSWI